MGRVVKNFVKEIETQMGAKVLVLVGWKDRNGTAQTTK
jgi:hypothetical protein